MHIGFLCHEYPPGKYGGIGTFTQTLARGLVRRGHRVTVVGIYQNREGVEDDQGVTVIRLRHAPIPRVNVWLNGQTLRKELHRIHHSTPFDVLDAPENGFALVGSTHFGRHIIRMHGGHQFFAVGLGQKPQLIKSWIERRSFRRADHFCAVSRFVAEVTRTQLNLGNCPIPILPNPVDTENFRPNPDIVPTAGQMIFVGTVTEKKGVRQLIQAFPAIARTVPHARLQIVGRDRRDPQTGTSFRDALRSLIPDALKPCVEFAGQIENPLLPDLLARAEVAVFPSHMESQGIVAAEAMAAGKAVIFSRTGPGEEIIEHSVSGLLCDPHDPVSIADCAIRLLQDADLRERLGKNARERAETQFAIAPLVERNLEFYRQCCGYS